MKHTESAKGSLAKMIFAGILLGSVLAAALSFADMYSGAKARYEKRQFYNALNERPELGSKFMNIR
jgi:hypothetical protein